MLCLGGCARKAPSAAPTVYPYSAAAQKVFYAAAEGLSEAPPTAHAASGEGVLASRAPNASVLSSDGTRMVAAINGWGMATIETAPSGAAYRIVGTPLGASFAGLTTGGAWPMGGGFLVQLFHDPFSEDPPPISHLVPSAPVSASRLAFFDAGKGAAQALDPLPGGLDPGFELFALLPAGGRWFAELRKDSPDRVDLKFLALGDPLAPARAVASPEEIGRAEFQAALQPKALASLPGKDNASLGSALALLGEGPWLVRLRTSRGDDAWYLSAGKPEEATSILAWSGSTETLALRSDGALAFSNAGGGTELLSLAAPVPGAAFTALTAIDGLAAIAWESGEFPAIASAGLVVVPLPRR
jgi:hypothetical protein